ncbi:hypothetical protein HPP92_010847 [Vanilla planifolia]|uniref:Cytochrome P450 n=1 Tax=Vanilla planifolia TaxID=51239 RepID=A0A835RAG2_VANPL|nr:hypothetical protein HPP92_010847 [Vanilla planifolia]
MEIFKHVRHTWSNSILFFLSLLFFCSLAFIVRNRRFNRHRLPPAPTVLPIVGHLHQLLFELPHIALCRLSSKHGPLMLLQLGQIPTIVASSPEIADEILKAQDHIFCGRPYVTVTHRFSYGGLDIAFAPHDDRWRLLRRLAKAEVFGSSSVRAFRDVREEEVRALLDTISSAAARGVPFDLAPMLLCLFNNIVYRKLFGKRISAPGNCGRSRHHELIMQVVAFTAETSVGDFFPCLGWIDVLTGWRSKLEKRFKAMDGLLKEEIEERMRNRRGRQHIDPVNFLDALLRSEAGMDFFLDFLQDQNVIKAVLMDMFLAGTEPPALTMEWAMAELMKNPKAMNKLQEEVRGVVGSKGKVEEEDLQKLPYVKSVLKETLRLHPPGPLLLPHESSKDTEIGGYHIPAGSRIFVNAWAIARDTRFWKDPEAFVPERFEGSQVDFRGCHMQLIPFGAGRRMCPGMSFGMACLELALANVVYAFDWAPARRRSTG